MDVGVERRFVREGTILATHRALAGLQFMVRIGPTMSTHFIAPDESITAWVRWEDSERLADLLDWIDDLEHEVNPFRGKAFELRPDGLRFLPGQQVDRDDLVLPASALDEVERNLAFLDDPIIRLSRSRAFSGSYRNLRVGIAAKYSPAYLCRARTSSRDTFLFSVVRAALRRPSSVIRLL